MENSQECLAFGSTQYVREAVDKVEEYIGKKGQKLASKALPTITSQYRPEFEIIKELGEYDASYYHSSIGVLR